jgi:hypothetical protein
MMKRYWMIVLLLVPCVFAHAQFSEGVLTYKVTAVETEDYRLQMLRGLAMDIHFTPQRQLTTMSALFGMFSQKILVEKPARSVDLFSSTMGSKYHVTFEEKEEDGEEEEELTTQIEYFPADQKTIAGYAVYRAVVTNTRGERVRKYELYIAEDLQLDVEILRDVEGLAELKGLPLEYTIHSPKLKLTFTAQAVTKELDPAVFDFDRSGYEQISPEEMKEKKVFGF